MTKRSPIYQPSRRGLLRSAAGLGGAGLLGGGGLLGRPARAASVSAADRKFIFVNNIGGWDPTRVFADGFDNDLVAMEPDAERASYGGISYISHPKRPQVDAFMRRYASRTAFIHGMLVPSIAHEACFLLILTGRTSDTGTDWPSLLGMAARDRYIAPNLVMGGPSFPGSSRPAVVQSGSNGQLADLLSGNYQSWNPDWQGETLSIPARQALDAFLRERANGYLQATPGGGLAGEGAAAFQNAIQQANGLQAQSREIDFAAISDLGDSMGVAIAALANGVSRCVMLCEPVTGERAYDSHTTNDQFQQALFSDLFTYLQSLIFGLEAQPGENAPTLLDETCVVVFSEMGRTPWLNAASGKDHWPYTSMMLVGSGVNGGQSFGGYDDGWSGMPIDTVSGELDEAGETITCQGLGATLLAMGGVDWTEHCPDNGPIQALTTDTF